MKKAELLDSLLKSAETSSSGLWRLNFLLHRVIPFNKPHAIKITSIGSDSIQTHLPYKRKNLNHLKGIHACAIATLAEYTSGLFLLRKASSSGYRIIMKTISVEYHYQARTGVRAEFSMKDELFQSKVKSKLEKEGVSLEPYVVEVHDDDSNHIATATILWQLKDWKKTKAPLVT